MRDDKVVVHELPRGYTCPSPSPFPIKLETFLRASGIDYEVDFTKPMSSKGKTPWLELNGEPLADSQLIIEHLMEYFNTDLDDHLTQEDKALSRMIRIMMEERSYWCGALERYQYGSTSQVQAGFPPLVGVPRFLDSFIKSKIKKTFINYGQKLGIGLHSRDELISFFVEDAKAVSVILGDKPFLFGDKISVTDCAVFGFVVTVLHNTADDHVFKTTIENDCPNLVDHYQRIRNKYWPDWEACKTSRN